MNDVQTLINRYLDQRESLDEAEFARLADAVEDSPELARALREQLVLDELLGQHLAIDRQAFHAQVEQRLHDYACGEQRLDAQAAQLRQLAESQLSQMPSAVRRRRRYRWLATFAATLLLLAGGCYGYWSLRYERPMATIRLLDGEVLWTSADGTSAEYTPAELSQPIRHGDQLEVAEDGQLHVQYADGTRVEFSAGSRASFRAEGLLFAKRVRLDNGRLAAWIAPQSWHEGVTFETPVAEARVLGTELALRTTDDSTRLDVFRGEVQFSRTSDGHSARVAAKELAFASAEELTVKPAQWPLFHEGLVARLDHVNGFGAQLFLPQQDDTALPLAPQGLAWLGREDRLILAGGGFVARDQQHIASAIRATGEWTLEMILLPKTLAIGPTATVLELQREDQSTLLALRQGGPNLMLELAGPEAGTEPRRWGVGSLQGPRPHHVALRYRDGQLTAWINEVATSKRDVHVEADHWQIHRIAIGAVDGADVSWRGTFSHLALYQRALADDDLAYQAESAMRSFQRPAAAQVLVRAVPISEVWTAHVGEGDQAPSLLVREFRAVEVLNGTLPTVRFAAAYWDVVDSHHAAILPETESQRIFMLEPVDDHPHVERLIATALRHKPKSASPDYFVVEWQ